MAGVAGVLLLVPLSCGTPSAPSRTTAPARSTGPAAQGSTGDGRPFTSCLRLDGVST